MTDPEPLAEKAELPAKSEWPNSRWIAAGAAMGIGSAALVAALLYANRGKAAEKTAPDPKAPPPETD